ncbi:MAG: hypothetical protein IPJ48_16840 [Propionivibrio sp.]|uniref:GtrA-like protein domain-containing protein n=1 Tax=Candidatus Propionivibrio dominans TaxID=2954373 RepID=A0A9D7F9M8_9RHOO|nr:hypothetical protein [Candidatus Propionivibrio dominans]
MRMFDPVLWRFIGVGMVNTLLGLGVIFAARPFVGFARYLPTIAAGYLANLLTLGIGLGLTNAYVAQTAAILSHVTVTYVLSRHFVFREHECSQQK